MSGADPELRGAPWDASQDASWGILLERLPIGVILCDAQGAVVRANDRAQALAGQGGDVADLVRLGGALEATWADGRPADPREAPAQVVIETGRAVRDVEVVFQWSGGRRRVLLVNAEPAPDAEGRVVGVIVSLQDITGVRDLQRAMETRQRWSQQMFEALPVAFYLVDPEGRLSAFNDAARVLWGREPRLGEDLWCGSLRLLDAQGAPLEPRDHPLARAVQRGEALSGAEVVIERPDGAHRTALSYPMPLHGPDGLFGAVNVLVDISERKAAADRQSHLLDELNHRVKNSLATVQSLALHSFRGQGEPREMRRSFEARLLALSAAHDQLARHDWRAADLREIAERVLSPHLGRLSLEGEPLRAPSKAAVALAMALNELATNAAKHGALSCEDGSVDLSWRVVDGRIVVDWTERGGPKAAAPAADGFGLRFIRRAVEGELDGEAAFDFAPAGLRCRIAFPLRADPPALRLVR